MGIINNPEVKVATPSTAKRKTVQTDFSKLGPLKNTGTKGFSSYRDKNSRPKKVGQKDEDAMDSDEDGDDNDMREEADDNDEKADESRAGRTVSPEDLEVAEGLRKIKVCSFRFCSPSLNH